MAMPTVKKGTVMWTDDKTNTAADKHRPAVAVGWMSSLRNQIGLALALLASSFTVTVAFTLYEVELRKHDYAILNLAGQLRVTAQAMAG